MPMNAWQHRQHIRRIMDKKNAHDRWFGEGKFKMQEQRVTIGEQDVLNLSVDSLAFLQVINGAAIRVAQVKEQLDIGRKTVTTPPIMGDWLESEALNYIVSQVPKLQEQLGAIAKGTNEGSLDKAILGLVDLFLASMKPLYNIGYLSDLILEQQAEELKRSWSDE